MKLTNRNIIKISELINEGWIDKKPNEDETLFIYNYTPKVQFSGYWIYETEICRGLILDKNNNIIAQGFKKFHNWGDATTDALLVEATEKMDGSLGILYRHNDQYKIATRGSFSSEQALWATEFLKKNYDLTGLDDNLTLLFEIIYPENRVVVNYGDFEGLVLIGAIERNFGRDYYYQELKVIADQFGFMLPKTYQFNDVRDALLAAHDITANEEGWVLRFSDGQRFKVKGEAYRHAHRFLARVTFDRVLDAVAEGVYDAMIEGIPDEFLDEVRKYRTYIDNTLYGINVAVNHHMTKAPLGTRKDFALYVKEHCPEIVQYMFMALDNRDFTQLVYKNLKGSKYE